MIENRCLVACGSDDDGVGVDGGVDPCDRCLFVLVAFAGSDDAGCFVRYRVRPEQEGGSRPGQCCTAVGSKSQLNLAFVLGVFEIVCLPTPSR